MKNIINKSFNIIIKTPDWLKKVDNLKINDKSTLKKSLKSWRWKICQIIALNKLQLSIIIVKEKSRIKIAESTSSSVDEWWTEQVILLG